MSFKKYPFGKDEIGEPCIELPDGTLITDAQILLALIKVLRNKGVITLGEIKKEL